MIPNIGFAVNMLSSHDITVDRPAASVYGSDGVAAAQTFTSFTVEKVSVQPTSGRDLVRAPEGSRPTESVTIFSPTELKERDRVTVPGRGQYEVEQVDPWAETAGYCKAIAKKLNSSEPRP